MTLVAALLWLSISPAVADDCAGLHPCDVDEPAADDLGAVADTASPDDAGEVIEVSLLDVETETEQPTQDGRDRYWYEPLTDLFWWPGEALAWIGLLGADHVDAAALTAWIAAVAAGAHRLWLWIWSVVAAPVAIVRRRLGLEPRPAAPVRERLQGVSDADREYLEALVRKESETYLAALKTEVDLEHQKYLDQCRRTEAAVQTLERILAISVSGSGSSLDEDQS
jgi:hypothetical protein